MHEFFDDLERIACVHMSGPSVRSHMNACQDEFRDVGSKQGDAHIGPLAHTECPPSRVDRSHHLQVSCKFTYQLGTVASFLLLTVTGRSCYGTLTAAGRGALFL